MVTGLRFRVPANILQIEPYKPGKPEEELKRELGVSRVIKMSSNENALGPSPLALEAIKKEASKTHRYPDGSGYYLRQALSEKFKVRFSNLILGNGSTDLVEIIARTYLEPQSNTVTADQSFIMYKIATLAMNANCNPVPTKNYAYDLEAILRVINQNTRIIFIANPNNPTGTMISKVEMDHFLNSVPANVLVVLDEAYIDYVDREDFPNGLSYLEKFPNVIVLRTFSKVYGLAGIRIGYGIACEEIINDLNRVRSPFNTNVLAQAAALAALQDTEHVRKSKESARQELAFLEEEFVKMNVPFVPSVTNFIFLPILNAVKIYELLLREGIIVRPMQSFNLQEGLRITLGRHEENVAFLEAFKKAYRSS